MSKAEERLAQDRDLRRTARGLFDQRLGLVKSDLHARSVSGRIADSARDRAFTALDNAIDVLRNSKGVIALTGGVLLGWFLRKPILAKALELLEKLGVQEAADSQTDEPEREH